MSEGSQDINQQFIDGGVIPGQLVSQEATSKTYVDGQLAQRDTSISGVAASAAAAQATANTGVSAAGAAQSTANTAVGLANTAQGSANTAQSTIDLHKASAVAHSAANITYTGPVEGAANTKQAIDLVKQRVDTIVAGAGASNTEILDARQPATGAPYPILGARLNNVDAQLADMVINVRNYGADNTGTADSGQAIRAALAVLRSNGGGKLYFPDGTYLIDSFENAAASPRVNFTLDISNLVVEGSSKDGVTILIGNGKIGEAVFGNFYAASLSNVRFSGLTFNLNGQNNLQNSGSRASKAAVLAYWCDGFTVNNCRVINAPGEHIFYCGAPNDQTNGKNIRIYDNEVYNVGDSVTGNTYLVDHSSIFVTGSNIWIHHNKFENPNKSMRATAVEVEGINFFAHTNSIKKYNLGIITARLIGSWTGANGTFTRDILVRNGQIYANIIEECLDGWWVENRDANGFKDVKFYDNIVTLSDETGNGTRYMVKGEATITFPVINLEIYNNTFKSNGNYATLSGTTLGIGIDFSTGLRIYNNKFINIAGFAIRLRGNSTYHTSHFEIFNNAAEDVCAHSAEGFDKAFSLQGFCTDGKIINNKIKNVNYTACNVGIQLYGGLSNQLAFVDVIVRDNEINVAVTDIESFLLAIGGISDNVFIYHKTNNASFDVRNQVQASAGSTIVNAKSQIEYVKRNVWNTYDRGTAIPTSGQRYQNDYRTNTNQTELGTSPNKYILKGWPCVTAGNPGTWREDRVLTGN